jgi:copper chaperone CopZ
MAAEPGMLKAVKRLMVTGSIKEKKVAIAAYTNLQAHAAKETKTAPAPTPTQDTTHDETIAASSTTTKSVFGPAGNASTASSSNTRPLQARAGLSMFGGDSVRSKSAHTFTVYVSGMSTEETRDQVEKVLIKVKGVISFFFDLCEQKVVIRSMLAVDDIITRIVDNGFKASTSKKDIGTATPETNKENNEPAYLDESKIEGANGSSWFGGFGTITLFGAETAEDRKAKQAAQNGNGWFSKLKIW